MLDQLLLVIAGGAVAIVGQWFQGWRTDRSAAASEAREQTRELERSAREIQDEAVRQIETAYSELVDTVRRIPELLQHTDEPLLERKEALIATLRQRALYLDEDLAQRVRLLTDIVQLVDELAPSRHSPGYHYDGKFTMTSNCRQEMHRQLSAHLRRQALPDLMPIVSQYSLALDEDYEDRREEFSQEIAESADDQEQWIARDPGARERYRVTDEA